MQTLSGHYLFYFQQCFKVGFDSHDDHHFFLLNQWDNCYDEWVNHYRCAILSPSRPHVKHMFLSLKRSLRMSFQSFGHTLQPLFSPLSSSSSSCRGSRFPPMSSQTFQEHWLHNTRPLHRPPDRPTDLGSIALAADVASFPDQSPATSFPASDPFVDFRWGLVSRCGAVRSLLPSFPDFALFLFFAFQFSHRHRCATVTLSQFREGRGGGRVQGREPRASCPDWGPSTN